jgi:hypothetical protein
MDTHQDITVKVEQARVAEFYEWFSRWLRNPPAAELADDGGDDTARKPWDPATDLELATKAWKKFPARAQLVFGTLIDHPGDKFTGEELAVMHDIPNGMYGVAGVLAWPGRQLRKIDRKLHFKAEANPDGGSYYWMNEDMASLFAQARAAA